MNVADQNGASRPVSGTDMGGGVVAAHVSLVEAKAQAQDISHFLWAFGDDSSTVTVAASAVSDSPPIDVRKLRRAEGTVHVILTGSGTAKLTVLGSRDGINNLHSLGDRITGMVAGTGSYILKLDDGNLAYFPYLTFRITETGGVSSVAVKVYVVARGG